MVSRHNPRKQGSRSAVLLSIVDNLFSANWNELNPEIMISLFKQGLSFKPLFNQTIFIQIIDNLSKLNNTSKASYSGLADQFAGFTSYHNF